MSYATQRAAGEELNRLYAEDRAVHEWYRFVLSYPPHLVREYVERFGLSEGARVLDPFCGTGTTLVECKKLGIASVGIEANPVVQFAARTKVRWDVEPAGLLEHARGVARATERSLAEFAPSAGPLFAGSGGVLPALKTLTTGEEALLIKGSVSPLPLHRVLTLQEQLERHADPRFYDHERLALAKHLVYSISNLRFGPEVGVGKAKDDAPVVPLWLGGVEGMARDLAAVAGRAGTPSDVLRGDARMCGEVLEPHSIDAVITSPPYPNEKDYSRTTRLESVLLGFIRDKGELKRSKRRLLRSNTRGVYHDDTDARWVADDPAVTALADEIEARRRELGKTSGFEKLYASVVRHYFGGMARHLESLKRPLRPGARLAYVVGDQASYFRIPIRTGELLARIAGRAGYDVEGIDLFRTRFSTATGDNLREEVVRLRWNP